MGARPPWKSIAPGAGLFLGLGSLGELVTKYAGTLYRLTSPAVRATAVIGDEDGADTRAITITLRDRAGNAINYAAHVHLEVFTTSGMVDWSAGGSTGIAQGATGKILALVAKKVFRAISSTSGVIAITFLDTGTTACHLGVRLPNGEMIYLGNMTNA